MRNNQDISYQQACALPQPLFVDLRSPSEFAEDHLPNAYNLPIFTDGEREQVGTVYHQQSHDKARFMALDLVAPKLPTLLRELQKLSLDYDLVLYCWRGGMRSQTIAQMAALLKIACHRLDGGYKAYRKDLTKQLEAELPYKLIVIHGLTGCGKTQILQILEAKFGLQSIDLEGLANHRGSVFGSVGLVEQPTQKHFQSLLWQKLATFDKNLPVFVECESKRVGKITLDPPFFKAMKDGRHFLVYDTVINRTARLIDDYQPLLNHQAIGEALNAPPLRKRFGQAQVDALNQLWQANQYDKLTAWLLENYYDPLYNYADQPDQNYELSVNAADSEQAAAAIAEYLQGSLGKF